MLKIKQLNIIKSKRDLESLPQSKCLINTVNANGFNLAQKDKLFHDALVNGDFLLPDGISIVYAFSLLRKEKIERIAGWDLFIFEMERLNKEGGTCFFMGSTQETLDIIKNKSCKIYPNIKIESYSPPYKKEFSELDNKKMVDAVNKINPDLLWIGMTAPKQEKWAYLHFDELNVEGPIGTIGAVFDFYAETVERAPVWWQQHGLEWLFRLIKEPGRMWKRYIIGNILFLWNIIKN